MGGAVVSLATACEIPASAVKLHKFKCAGHLEQKLVSGSIKRVAWVDTFG